MIHARVGRIGCWMLAWGMAASSGTAGTAHSQTVPLADARQQVLDVELVWVAAEHNHDTATLRRILDDQFVASFGTAKPQNKETFIQAIVSGELDPTETQSLTDRTVIIDRDTAIVIGTDTEHGTRKGVAYTAVARYTATYIRRNEHWVALAEHLVEVPQGK